MKRHFQSTKAQGGPDRLTRAIEPTDRPPEPERYVRWRNNTARMVEPVIHGKKIRLWAAKTEKSCPESWSPELEALGMTRIGYVQ